MATDFERRVCRLIDADSKPINWSNSSPFDRRGGRISVSSLCVRGCACHQAAWPCLKFRTVHMSIFPVGNPGFLKDNISKDIIGPYLCVWLRRNAYEYTYMHKIINLEFFVKILKENISTDF